MQNDALQLLEDTRDALLVIGDDNTIRYANQAARTLLGATVDLAGQALALPDVAEGVSEVTLPRVDGSPVDVEVYCTPTRWDGQPARLLSLRDASRHRSAARQLHLLKRSLESTTNGIVICDAQATDHPIIYVNPAFEHVTGYSEADVLGKNCRFLQQGKGDPVAVAEIRDGLKARRDVHVVLRNFRKDGSLLWNELFISPIVDEQGEVTHFVGVINDVTEQKRYESELMFTIHHDILTGLPNRTLLEDRLQQACQTAVHYRKGLAVLFIDIDGFKPINDSLGHQVGDQLLAEAAKRMGAQVRAGDTVARMGGDEFIVLLANLDGENDVACVVDRLVRSLGRPYRLAGSELHITVSIGIAWSDGRLEAPTQLIQQADLAMYKAKQQGRNNCQWYTDDLNQRVSERLALRNDLRRAIEQDSLELYYQPQLDGRSGRVVAVEALLRWNHPQRGFIPPAELIHAAEDAGQISSLSAWVLHTACAFNKRLLDEGIAHLVVAVNISAALFRNAQFLDVVQAALQVSGLPAELLELEVTEAVFLDNAEAAIATLQALRERGVRVAIDDFGTGLSSLNNLKRLPINKVKVDKSFIAEVISDRHDADITQGIISMAHHLRLQVVAEGVETEAQYLFLRKIQCDGFQGFHFARPMPYEELEVFLRQQRDLNNPQAAATAQKRQTLLLLDDEANILRALGRVLRRDGYEILMATSAREAFEILARYDVQVIISDQRMPEMNGTEFLSRVKGLYPHTVRIVLSGYTDLGAITDAINQGEVYKFLLKPWDDENLRQVVAEAFRQAAVRQGVRAELAQPH